MHTMTYHVPDWDNRSYGVTALQEYANLCHIEKGGIHEHQNQALQPLQYLQYHHSLQQRKSDSALVPNHDVLDDLIQTEMQGSAGTHSTDGPACSSIPALEVPVRMTNPGAQEDEMLSWLRYPLEDSFDRNYCSEMFGDIMNPHVQLVKNGFLQQTMKEPESTLALNIDGSMGCEQVGLQLLTKAGSTVSPPRPGIKSDAAMALGAGRAAGLLSQTGSEAFNCVRTHVNPCALVKSLSSASMEPLADGKRASYNMVDPVTTAVPPGSSGFNFSLFSRPVATTLDSLRLVGGASGPTNVERVRQPLAKDLDFPCEPNSSGDSIQSNAKNMASAQLSREFSSKGRGAKEGSVSQGLCSPTSLPCRSVVRAYGEAAELNSHATCVSVSENVVGISEAVEATLSPSCLSRSSSEKITQEAFTPSPKKSSSSAQYSEDVEDVAANAKKPPPGPRSVKRSRAAETHNESEKKRRNKINVRLKTDKASVLDEAIEYTKMLQAQVQFMSMKTGMFFPAMMSSGMHYVPMQQMPTFPHLGMGMGMGMAMGMGMGVDMGVGMHVADMNAATPVGVGAGVIAGTGAGAGATINLSSTIHQPPPGIAYAGTRLLPTGSPSPNHDVSGCLPPACTSEPYKAMISQQPLQPVLMNVQRSADVYSASLQQRPPLQANHMTNAFG